MDKLQRAGRAFLLRLVAEYGPVEAARILRRLADELETFGAISPGLDAGHKAKRLPRQIDVDP
jgi:hypothetical protein